MKIKTYIILLSAILFSCNTVSYFNTPNDLLEMNCILHLKSGSAQQGRITILFETGHEAKDIIEFTHEQVRRKVLVDSVQSYEINGKHYLPKILDVDLNGEEKLLFVKRLTPAASRLHLYELYQKNKLSSNPNDLYYYFISFPHQDNLRPVNIAGKQIIPNFDEKMSRLLADCPSLAKKIEQKSKGYFLPQFSLGYDKKIGILMRIIQEYNACK